MLRRIVGLTFVLLFQQALTLFAQPPFVYASALNWVRDTIHSEVPEQDRLYVLGPDRTKEYYGLNNGIGTHDLETRLVVSAILYRTISDLLSDLPFKHRNLEVLIWRAGNRKDGVDWPVYRSSMGHALHAPFALQPDDMTELKETPVPGTITF